MKSSENRTPNPNLTIWMVPILLLTAVLSICSGAGHVQADGTWSNPVEISSEEQCFITSEGESLYSYWRTMTCSLDGGATWSDESAHTGMIEASDGTLYRVNMSDEEESAGTILFSLSDDDGVTWSDTVEVFPLEAWNDGAFGIHMIQGVLFVYSYDWAGWSDGSIIVSKSSDYGETWSSADTVDSNVHVEDPLPADIVYSEGSLYLIYWTYETTPEYTSEVVIVESTDMGDSWEDRRVISNGILPLIKADSGMLHVTYWNYDGGPEPPVLEFIKSDDGDTWSTPVEVGIVEAFDDPSNLHSLAVSSGEVFVAYGDCDPSWEEYTVKINYSADGGDTWADMGDVTGTSTNTMTPALSIEGTMLHFTWVDVGSGSWSDEGTTYYRSLVLMEEPIPEFSSPAAVAGIIVAVVAILIASKSRREKRP